MLLRLDISGIPLAPVHPYSEGSSEKTPVTSSLDLLTSLIVSLEGPAHPPPGHLLRALNL